jgi:uncharacterized membrane protein YdfJ with MMPL/SSD domain
MNIDAIFRALGRWAVRLRWLVVLIWIARAVAAVTQLPALSSVTQSNNSKFLPASAPSQHAIDLAAPFGNPNLVPIPIIAATTSGPLTPADVTALTTLQRKIAADPNIKDAKAGLRAGLRVHLAGDIAVQVLGRWNWWPSKLRMDRGEPPEPPSATPAAEPSASLPERP